MNCNHCSISVCLKGKVDNDSASGRLSDHKPALSELRDLGVYDFAVCRQITAGPQSTVNRIEVVKVSLTTKIYSIHFHCFDDSARFTLPSRSIIRCVNCFRLASTASIICCCCDTCCERRSIPQIKPLVLKMHFLGMHCSRSRVVSFSLIPSTTTCMSLTFNSLATRSVSACFNCTSRSVNTCLTARTSHSRRYGSRVPVRHPPAFFPC